MKKAIILSWMLICMLALSGCVPLSVDLQRADQPVSMPEPAGETAAPAVGDSQSAASYYVPLYSVSEDQQLISFKRAISVESGESLIEKTLLVLLRMDGAIDRN